MSCCSGACKQFAVGCLPHAVSTTAFGFYTRTGPAAVFLLVYCYVQSLIAIAFVMSTFFNQSKVSSHLCCALSFPRLGH